jgi:hypothetical protein
MTHPLFLEEAIKNRIYHLFVDCVINLTLCFKKNLRIYKINTLAGNRIGVECVKDTHSNRYTAGSNNNHFN